VLLALLDEEVKLELAALFQELAEGQTPESRFVKQADKLETWLQSRWYAGEYPDLPMASFQREIDELPLHPALAKIRDTERLA
jgi:5'-deoxynucleotidase YfbR-like HD superfamily hydrolase